MKTFTANAIAETFERDRGVVIRALRDTKPDAVVTGKPQWKLSTASRALERHNRKSNDSGGGTIDPNLAKAYSAFDQAYDEMVALPTLERRRAAAKARLAPLIARTDQLLREHGKAIGADEELTALRADRLYLLALRGLEAPCAWSFEQAAEQIGC